jgi:hypothetical protein
MDLYLFYNCLNNISEVISTPENKLTLKHQIIINDPLVLPFYLKKLNLNALNNNFSMPKTINVGGASATGVAAASGNGGVPGAPGGKKSAQEQLAQEKLKDKKKKEEDNKKKKNDQNKKDADNAEKADEDAQSAEVEEALENSKDAGDLDGLKKFLKTFGKILIGFLVVLMIPIIPFVLVTIYAFKNLQGFFTVNMNRL